MKRASKCKLLQISRPHIFPDSALHFPVRGARAKHRAVAQSYVSVRRAAQSHWVIFFPLSPFFLFSSRQLHSRAVRVCARSQMTYYLYSAATRQPGPILTNWRRTMAHFPTLLKSDPLPHCSLPGSHFYVRARARVFRKVDTYTTARGFVLPGDWKCAKRTERSLSPESICGVGNVSAQDTSFSPYS